MLKGYLYRHDAVHGHPTHRADLNSDLPTDRPVAAHDYLRIVMPERVGVRPYGFVHLPPRRVLFS